MPCVQVKTAIRYVSLHGAAQCAFPYRNRAVITFVTCEQKPFPAWRAGAKAIRYSMNIAFIGFYRTADVATY